MLPIFDRYLREDDCMACGHAPLPPIVASYEPDHQAVVFASIGTGDARLNMVLTPSYQYRPSTPSCIQCDIINDMIGSYQSDR
jgi:hypothetical protein